LACGVSAKGHVRATALPALGVPESCQYGSLAFSEIKYFYVGRRFGVFFEKFIEPIQTVKESVRFEVVE
jgi:hypothetical protein